MLAGTRDTNEHQLIRENLDQFALSSRAEICRRVHWAFHQDLHLKKKLKPALCRVSDIPFKQFVPKTNELIQLTTAALRRLAAQAMELWL